MQYLYIIILTGIFFHDGEQLIESRRFILRNLRDYGFGRRFQELEDVIEDGLHEFVDLLRNGPKYAHEEKYVQQGKVLSPAVFAPLVTNTFLHILCNEKYSREDQVSVYELCDLSLRSIRNGDDYGKIMSCIPWLRHIAPNMSGYNELRGLFMSMFKFTEDLFNKYDETYDPDYSRNFLDILNKAVKTDDTGVFDRKFCFYFLLSFC